MIKLFNPLTNEQKLIKKLSNQIKKELNKQGFISFNTIEIFAQSEYKHLLSLPNKVQLDWLTNKDNHFPETGCLTENFYIFNQFLDEIDDEDWNNQAELLQILKSDEYKNIFNIKVQSAINKLVISFCNEVDLRKIFKHFYQIPDSIPIDSDDFIESYEDFILLLLRLNTLNYSDKDIDNMLINNNNLNRHFFEQWITIMFERNLSKFNEINDI